MDFYRPKFVVFENIPNFSKYNKSQIFKKFLQAMLRMGYAISFGILQAAHYGVAQNRNRFIIVASAFGFSLPLFPEPMFSFKEVSKLKVNGHEFENGNKFIDSAPYRQITIRDMISDLNKPPLIQNGTHNEVTQYEIVPQTDFQRNIRNSENLLNHICQKVNELVKIRIELIPGMLSQYIVYQYNIRRFEKFLR